MKIIKMFLIGALSLSIAPPTYANFDHDETQKAMFDLGYQSVYDAIKKSNIYFKNEIALPVQIPPLPFTHVLGRFNQNKDPKNSSLEIEYLNQNASPYRITIFPKKSELQWNYTTQTFILKDGSAAHYFTTKWRNYFYFEQNKWKYLISVHPNVSNVVTPELLVEIANSIY
ncbi:hypothetical protein [Peribacillus sp. Hz7]|uniref:hypothetical protein n=1 Tax=Peribacillus sp. Hz7 TaxID=3344873 RepID=UPI0035CBDC4E